ncbi:MAG: hypothetical protein ACYSYV_08515 [Planctomycetota bacterium]|jgi:hypothetical protein
MSTEAQIKANQQNAQRSTGPRTAEGKAAVSQNAVKHGLFSSQTVVKGENEADFDLFSDKLLAELAPVGALESMLAERFVNLSWRLRRAEHMQNQAIDVMIAQDGPSPLAQRLKASLPKFLQDVHDDPRGGGPELILGRAAIDDCANYRTLERLSMYERRIETSMLRTLRELESRQAMREIREREAQAIPKASGFEAATRTIGEMADLKKQSQFASAQTGAKTCVLREYENARRREQRENRAKQSQSPAFGRKSEARAVD